MELTVPTPQTSDRSSNVEMNEHTSPSFSAVSACVEDRLVLGAAFAFLFGWPSSCSCKIQGSSGEEMAG